MSGTTYDDPQSGVTAGIFPFPAFELFRKNDDGLFDASSRTTNSGTEKPERDDQRTGRPCRAAGTCRATTFADSPLPPAAGRLIIPDDDRAGAPAVAVLSYAFSQRRFGDAANAAGQSDSDQQRAVHRGGSRAAGILRRRSRGGAGPLSSDAHQSSCWALVSSLAFDPRTISLRTTTGSRSWGDCVPA